MPKPGPKILEKTDRSIPELRVLRALAGGACLTLADLRRAAGTAQAEACRALLAQGLLARDELDLDGAKEVTWRLTEAGEGAAEAAGLLGALPPVALKGGPEIGALVQVFGGNRLLGPKVGRALEGCKWVGVPFCGGLSEVPWMAARTLLCADAHCHLINLARVVMDEALLPDLEGRLEGRLFHELELSQAQERCLAREFKPIPDEPDPAWAADFFTAAWMARAGQAGTAKEFAAPLSIRWDAGGGDSVKRFRGACACLRDWLRLLAGRATFVRLDAFDFLAKVKDLPGHGVYLDPPFFHEGKSYKHKFGPAEHARLAEVLGGFSAARVVQRCYDCQEARALYPEAEGWRWELLVGKKQTNENAREALVVRN